MHFHILCKDVPNSQPIRTEFLKPHLDHIKAAIGGILIAGPLRDAEGVNIGSMLVVEAEDAAAARAMIEADPYFKHNLWQSIEVTPFMAAAGQWVGGAAW